MDGTGTTGGLPSAPIPAVILGLSQNPCPILNGIQRGRNIVKTGYVYILASKYNGTLYVGVTPDLIRRVYEHRNDLVDGFTKKYSVHNLVYYEDCGNIRTAIAREKQIKGWRRTYKTNVIDKFNPEWRDLYAELSGAEQEMDSGIKPE
jgi:putative endonuclease